MFTTEELSDLSIRMQQYARIGAKIKNTFNDLVFEPNNHVYEVNRIPMTSTSKYIAQFEGTPFNSFAVSYGVTRGQNNKVYAQKHKLKTLTNRHLMSKQMVMRRYKLMADQAIAMGNRVHEFSETYPFFIKPHCEQEEGVISWFKRYLGPKSKYVYVGSEIRVYDIKTRKAGTIDLLMYNTITNKLVIVDWKTNHKSLLMGYKNSKLTAPFDKLSSCPYNKYSLQLSDYKNMIESSTSFEVEDCLIVHLFPVEHNYISKYKNKKSYALCNNFVVKSKTKFFTVFKALNLCKELKATYKVINNEIDTQPF
jgi:hypothetical protein